MNPVLAELRGTSILDEAHRLVRGDRAAAYGDPLDTWANTAEIMSGILRPILREGASVTAELAVLCMIGVKLAREAHLHRRDSIVDIAGYADVLDVIVSERLKRSEP